MSDETKEKYSIYRDGSAWCAVDDDFIDLQTSNAGFGDTPIEAIGALLEIEGGCDMRRERDIAIVRVQEAIARARELEDEKSELNDQLNEALLNLRPAEIAFAEARAEADRLRGGLATALDRLDEWAKQDKDEGRALAFVAAYDLLESLNADPPECVRAKIPKMVKTTNRFDRLGGYVGTTTSITVDVHEPCDLMPGADFLLVKLPKEKP